MKQTILETLVTQMLVEIMYLKHLNLELTLS
jgi:hypothetical protein